METKERKIVKTIKNDANKCTGCRVTFGNPWAKRGNLTERKMMKK